MRLAGKNLPGAERHDNLYCRLRRSGLLPSNALKMQRFAGMAHVLLFRLCGG
jgi:hypothetical protein